MSDDGQVQGGGGGGGGRAGHLGTIIEVGYASRHTDRQHLRTHTHKVVEKIVKDSQSPAASCERTGCEDCLKARSSSEPVNKS